MKIELKRNKMQIGGEGIEIFLVNVMLKYEIFKKTKIFKNTLPCLFIWEWAKHILVWNCPMMMRTYDLWNLKLSYLNEF
jgi:hypothetical protein